MRSTLGLGEKHFETHFRRQAPDQLIAPESQLQAVLDGPQWTLLPLKWRLDLGHLHLSLGRLEEFGHAL